MTTVIRTALAAVLTAPMTKPVTSSFGVAELSREEDGECFLGRADTALYQAKKNGRNRVVAADSPLSQQVTH